MNYNEIKKNYDIARREQLNADKELTRIAKELKATDGTYSEIESSFQTRMVNDKAKALEAYRKSKTDPIEAELSSTEQTLTNTKKEYEEKRSGITYDNLLANCSSKQEILEDVHNASSILSECLQGIVGNRFYKELTASLEHQEFEFTDESLPSVIQYFNESEVMLDKLSKGSGGIDAVFDKVEDAVSPDEEGDKTVSLVLAVGVGIGVVLLTKIFLPVYAVLLTAYGAYNIFRNSRVYRILIVQKAVQDNINHIDDLLKKQIEEEVNNQLNALDSEYVPAIEGLEKKVTKLKQSIIDISAEADNTFVYNSKEVESLKSAAISKADNQRSSLLTQKKRQEEILAEKTKIVQELGEQLGELLQGLRQQYLQGVGKEVIFEPHFLFDIDMARNKPVFFTHPQTRCLFLYDDAQDVYNFVRLITLQLRAKLNPFNLSVTVTDVVNSGNDLVYFNSVEDKNNSLFQLLTTSSAIKEKLTDFATDFDKRQTNIRKDFETIEKYNKAMLEMNSLTESYLFFFFIDPEAATLTEEETVRLLRVGGELGIYTHLFIAKSEFAAMKDTAASVLDNVGKTYFLSNGNYLERAKDFISETLLQTDD